MGVTFSRHESHKSARKNRKGCIKTALYCDGTLNEEVIAESGNSQTFPKVTYEDLNKELERKNQELVRKNEMLAEHQLRLREYQLKMETLEQIRAKIVELEQENQELRARMRPVKVDSPQVAKPSVKFSHAPTSTDQQGAEEKRVKTKETATNTDTEASLDTSDGSNTNTSCKAKNAQVGNHNIMNIVGLITLGRYGNDQNADEKAIRDAQLRVQDLEKSKRALQRELQIEKDKVEILRRQNEVLEGRETKLLENSLPFRTADFTFIRNLKYL